MSHEIFYMFHSLKEVTPKKILDIKYCNVLLFLFCEFFSVCIVFVN